MMHADSDGVWSVTDRRALADELRTIDVDGEPLLGRLQGLVEVAIDVDAPIWFQ